MQVPIAAIDQAADVDIRTDHRMHVFLRDELHFVRVVSLLFALDLGPKIIHVFLEQGQVQETKFQIAIVGVSLDAL